MSQNRKAKIQPGTEAVTIINQPLVREFSTGGGHGPGDTLVEGDQKIITKKWQGYAPENLNVLGKSMPPMPEVSIPRFLGKADYASRIVLPNMLYLKFLTSPHPHARIKNLDTSRAEKMPGVAFILTYKNAPKTYPLPEELNFQGEVVAIVAADTEDLAEDAVEVISVEYDVLPFAATLNQVMAPNAPDLQRGRGNLLRMPQNDPHYDPNATWVAKHGDIDKGFAQAEIIKEFSYTFGGATAVPIQPCGSVAKWDGDNLTFWAMGQAIYPTRADLARSLGMDATKIRYINRYNGCTFAAARGAQRFEPAVAYIAKMTGRPVKLMLPKDQELAYLTVKPENLTKFKVGAMKDGRMVAILHEIWMNCGDATGGAGSGANSEISKNATEFYTAFVPNWKSSWWSYKSNAIRLGAVRSNTQQEVKWAWENMIDEMAEAVGKDPIEFRMMHMAKPGTKLFPVRDWHANDLGTRFEIENGALTYDSFASVEVLQEGAKVINWENRNKVAGDGPGRFKKGIGLAMSQHHAGHMGYHEGELFFEKRLQEESGGGQGREVFGAELEVTPTGTIIMKNALPDSGTNHDTALAMLVAEMLGFTTRDPIRVVWGDSAVTPESDRWHAGRTITLQGAAVCSSADKLRKDLLRRAAAQLKVDAETLHIKDGVISSKGDPRKRTTFAELVRLNKGPIRQQGRGISRNQGRAMSKGVGACFVEVEVDTWTGDWKFLRAAYAHDTGFVINPMCAEADMHGSLVQSTQMTTDPLPWDREFAGTRHYSVGYLSYRLPTIMDVPDQAQVFVNSLEPRWFYGVKSFSETSIGSVPGAISNAIYNACGVRIREHPITREKIMVGLKAKKA
jgi:CO/xanthine dehydrogenase Mo-binding subunit